MKAYMRNYLIYKQTGGQAIDCIAVTDRVWNNG